MQFTEKSTQYYNGVTEQDLKDFEKRDIIFNSTQSSCLGSENAVLILENEQVFYTKMNAFFDRLKASKKISAYSLDYKITLFYKWILNFLSDNQETNKQVKYVFEKTKLDELKEAIIILAFQELKERNLI